MRKKRKKKAIKQPFLFRMTENITFLGDLYSLILT